MPWFGLVLLAAQVGAGEWITVPSYFTHDPQNGQSVQQHTPIGPIFVQPRGDYQKSGYRHTRSSIQAGGRSDNLHIVEEWGRPVRPYGEWRFPYRPNAVPYDLWGPPIVGPPGYGYARPHAQYRRGHGPHVNHHTGRFDQNSNPGYGSPSYGNPNYGNPSYGNPSYGNPSYGNPSYGNLGHGNPSYGNPGRAESHEQPRGDGRITPYDSRGPNDYRDQRFRDNRRFN